MAAALSPEAKNRADALNQWFDQQNVDYSKPDDFRDTLDQFAAEVQKLQKDKDTSKGARSAIEKLLKNLALFGAGSPVPALEDLNHVAMRLVAKLNTSSHLDDRDFDALAKRIQDIRQNLQNMLPVGVPNANTAPNNAPANPELQALQDTEKKIEELVEKGKQAGAVLDAAIVGGTVRSGLTFNYNQGGVAKTDNYPTAYHLAIEIAELEKNAEFGKLVNVAGKQTASLLANPVVDAAEKWGKEVSQLKVEMTAKVKELFDADPLVVAVIGARTALGGPAVKFDGSQNLSAQTAALDAAVSAMKTADFPGASATLRVNELTPAEALLKQAKLSEWIRNLATTAPKLKALIDFVTGYPATATGPLKEHRQKLDDLITDAQSDRSGLTSDQAEYVKTNFDPVVEKVDGRINNDLTIESGNLSSPEYQYDRKKEELEALSDWDLVDASLTQGSKVHIEEHGGIDLNRPIEKAVYDVLAARIFTDPEIKRNEPGYRSTDAGGDAKFDKWLLARGRMSLRAFKRKFVDSGAARSNVGLWKAQPQDNASELTMFAFLMNRGPLMLETYHHPVVGPFLTELMERMLAQGSLRKGVMAVRGTDGRYYPKRLRSTDPQPSAADIASGQVLLPDPEFNYDKMHQPNNGIAKFLTNKVRELIQTLQPQFNLDAFYLSTIEELAVSIFCDFNYVDVISSSAQERTQTPISPRTALVSAIEAVQNLAANVAHTLLRYRAERKSQNWFAPMINYEEHLDAIGPHVGDSDHEHEKDVELLEETIHKITTFYSIHFNASVLHRAGTPEKLGKVKMAPLAHSLGVPNMHETLMVKDAKETVGRDKVNVMYDYDKYMMTLSMWSKFLDSVIEGMPDKMTPEDVEKSSDNKGLIDTLITKILAVAKLVPGTHYDLVPIMLYTVSQRILARFVDHRDRMQVLGFLKRRFTEACNKGQGLDAFAPQMKPFLKMFGVGTLDAEDLAALTYVDTDSGNRYHKDFAPVKDRDQRQRVYDFLVSEWNEKHPGIKPPPVTDLRRPWFIDWSVYKLATGDLTKAAEEFYHQLEHLAPEAPADRVGIKDDVKK